jgi:dihydroorotate dehydrogenase
MAKDKKKVESKTSNSHSATKAGLKEKGPKQKAVATKNQPKAPQPQSATWVATVYQWGSVIRVGNRILNCAHPASYFKLAKDNIAMPLARMHCSDSTKNRVFLTTEIIECAISPTIYTVNKVVHLISKVSSAAVKVCFNVRSPEIKAAVDVAFSEAAYQTTNRLFTDLNKNRSCPGFFKMADNRITHTANAIPFTPREQYQLISKLPSKL